MNGSLQGVLLPFSLLASPWKSMGSQLCGRAAAGNYLIQLKLLLQSICRALWKANPPFASFSGVTFAVNESWETSYGGLVWIHDKVKHQTHSGTTGFPRLPVSASQRPQTLAKTARREEIVVKKLCWFKMTVGSKDTQGVCEAHPMGGGDGTGHPEGRFRNVKSSHTAICAAFKHMTWHQLWCNF